MDDLLRARLARACPEAFGPDVDVDPDGQVVPADRHVDVAWVLKDAGYTLYVTVVATHFPTDDGDTYEVATVLRRPAPGAPTFRWRVRLGAEAELPSLYRLYPGADWQEREQYDLVGVRFTRHPDLRRIMLPEDWEGHPLRRDYAIDTPHAPWR